jgi:hypothetical protein
MGMTLARLQSLTIIWTPTPIDSETRSLIRMVSQARGAKTNPVWLITYQLIMEAIEIARPKWQAEVAHLIKAQAEKETPELLAKELAAAERAMALAKAKMDAKMESLKAAQAAAQKAASQKK